MSTALLRLACAVPALVPMRQEVEQEAATLFGHSLAALGDLDGDGVVDYAVGAPEAFGDSAASGAVLLFTGADHELLRVVRGLEGDTRFGLSLRAVQDADGDGQADLAVGHFPREFGNFGCLISSASGERLVEFGTSGDVLGETADLDDDGRPDLVWWGPYREATFTGVFSSTSGELLETLVHGGEAVLAPLAPASPWGRGEGAGGPAYLRLRRGPEARVDLVAGGTRGVPVLQRPRLKGWECFPAPAVAVSRLDVDDVPDVLLGNPEACGAEGVVVAWSGRTGRVLYEIEGGDGGWGDGFGASLALVGDVDADGSEDFVAGRVRQLGRRLECFSGRDGSLLWERDLEGVEQPGVSLARLSDHDGDGLDDLLVGCGDHTFHGAFRATGAIALVSSRTGDTLFVRKEQEVPALARETSR